MFPPQNPALPAGPGWAQGARAGFPPQGVPSAAAYEIQNAELVDSEDFTPGGFQHGIDFNPDGTELFVLDAESDELWQVNLPTGFDLTGGTLGDELAVSGAPPMSLKFSLPGTLLYVIDGLPSDQVVLFELGTGYDITSGVSGAVLPINGITCVSFNDDGSKAYFTTSSTVDSYTLSVAYDLRFRANLGQFTPGFNSMVDVVWVEGGTKAFILDFFAEVYEYSAGTAYDVTSLSFVQSVDFSGDVAQVVALRFSSNGSKMFLQAAGGPVLEYDGLGG